MPFSCCNHLRKAEADDPFDLISGTLGLVGCADTGLVLMRGQQGTTLYMRGRDVEEAEKAISFNNDTCRWSILGDVIEVRGSDTRKKILTALEVAVAPMNPGAIATATDLTRNIVDRQLGKMLRDGEVTRLSQGKYVHPNNEHLM